MPGNRLNSTSGKPMAALCSAMITSLERAVSKPPPSASPCTREIVVSVGQAKVEAGRAARIEEAPERAAARVEFHIVLGRATARAKLGNVGHLVPGLFLLNPNVVKASCHGGIAPHAAPPFSPGPCL